VTVLRSSSTEANRTALGSDACDTERSTLRARVHLVFRTRRPCGVNSTNSFGVPPGFTASPFAVMRFPFGARTSPSGPCRLKDHESGCPHSFPLPNRRRQGQSDIPFLIWPT